MSEKTEKIKKHFRDNKKTYIIGGSCLVVSVAVGVVIYKTNRAMIGTPTGEVDTQLVQQINQTVIGWKNNQMVVNLIERSTPSKPVHLVGTNLFFNSLNEAARETGHSVQSISKNVNGLIPDVKGDIFQLLDKAA